MPDNGFAQVMAYPEIENVVGVLALRLNPDTAGSVTALGTLSTLATVDGAPYGRIVGYP